MGVFGYSPGRTCDGCGSKMPPFFPRSKDVEGKMVCPQCLDRKMGAQSRAVIHYARQNNLKLAHDSGDGETIYHCPFCGAGQVVGRSDGTVECQFCSTAFTVQVQPIMSAQPQTIDGEPQKMPGMPGDQPGEVEPEEDPVNEETELAPGEGEDDISDMGKDPSASGPEMKSKPVPFQSKKTGSEEGQVVAAESAEEAMKQAGPDYLGNAPQRAEAMGETDSFNGLPLWRVFYREAKYKTSEGALLSKDDYIHHLAIRFADDRDRVIAEVRSAKEG